MGALDGKVVLITGAARGQGLSHALRCASEGASVALIDACRPFSTPRYEATTQADLDEAARLVMERGADVLSFVCDIRDSVGLIEAVAAVMERWGRLDVLVANAGIATYAPFLEITDDQWDEMIDINLTGTFRTVRAALPAMIDAGNGGSVVLIGSTASIRGTAYTGHYVAAKHGVAGLMRTLAIEFAGAGIRVNAVCPGSVNTLMGTDPDIAMLADDPARSPLFLGSFRPLMTPGMMEPGDVTDTVFFLASDASRHITGQLHAVDAGVTAW